MQDSEKILLIKEVRAVTQAGLKSIKDCLEETNWDVQQAIDLIKTRGLNIVSGREDKIASEGSLQLDIKDNFASLIEINCRTDFCSRSSDFIEFAELCSKKLSESINNNQPFIPASITDLESARRSVMAKTKENIVIRRWFVEESLRSNVKVFSYLHNNGKIGTLLTLSASSVEIISKEEFIRLGTNLAMQVAAMNPLEVSSNRLSPEVIVRQKGIFQTQLKELNKPESSWEKIMNGKMNKWFSDVCLLDQEYILSTKSSVKQTIKKVADSLKTEIEVIGFTRVVVGEGLEPEKKDFVTEVNNLANAGGDFEESFSLLK